MCSPTLPIGSLKKLSLLETPAFSELPDYVDAKELSMLFDARERSFAMMIIDSIFESLPRRIENRKFGIAFPIYPELMAFAIGFAKGKDVLEIAGASGENAMLFAFAGAQKVYMNDIDPDEMATFNANREQLPQNVDEKLEPIEGNCLDILTKKSDLKVDLVLCRNLIHFFNDKEQELFFENLKKILKPGGIAIFTVNSLYVDSSNEQLLETNPDATAFRVTQCVLTDYKTNVPTVLSREIKPTLGENVSTDFEERYLYQKKTGESKWQVFRDQFKQLDPELQKRILRGKGKDQWNSKMKSLKEGGSIRILTNVFRGYSESNLKSLFEKNGFEVQQGFSLQSNGHLAKGYEFGKVQQIGVIVQAS